MSAEQIVMTCACGHTIDSGMVRQMAYDTLREACRKARDQGAIPISAVDDLSMTSIGPWVDDFALGLTEAALIENVSISGGEMAQMPDTYVLGYVGVVVFVVAWREARDAGQRGRSNGAINDHHLS